ncbi:MAG: hypothetical protein GY853_14645 [PVC group bacterium]|nr:hypothetical protein [PVC group bacterium]
MPDTILKCYNPDPKDISIIKAEDGTDTNIIEFPISTQQQDRHGEIIIQKGIKTQDYNGVVLFNHDSQGMPIGKVVDIRRDQATKTTYAKIEFDNITPEDVAIFEKVKNKTLRSVSVRIRIIKAGYRKPTKYELDNGGVSLDHKGEKLYFIEESELLEISIVNIPANPGATRAASLDAKREENEQLKSELANYKQKDIISTIHNTFNNLKG